MITDLSGSRTLLRRIFRPRNVSVTCLAAGGRMARPEKKLTIAGRIIREFTAIIANAEREPATFNENTIGSTFECR